MRSKLGEKWHNTKMVTREMILFRLDLLAQITYFIIICSNSCSLMNVFIGKWNLHHSRKRSRQPIFRSSLEKFGFKKKHARSSLDIIPHENNGNGYAHQFCIGRRPSSIVLKKGLVMHISAKGHRGYLQPITDLHFLQQDSQSCGR